MAGAGVGQIDGGSNGGLLGAAGDGNRVCSTVAGASQVGQVSHVGGAPTSVGELEAGLWVGLQPRFGHSIGSQAPISAPEDRGSQAEHTTRRVQGGKAMMVSGKRETGRK